MELDNGMTRFIAGDENDLFINRTAIGECDEKLLDKAIYNLDNWFAVAGLVEKFDETVLLLGKVLGWRNSFYLPRNRGKDRKKPDIGSGLVEKIKARNYLDVRLYEYIQKRFYNDLERYGISEDTVNQFRKKNELYSQTVLPVYEVYDSMKALIKGEWNRPR